MYLQKESLNTDIFDERMSTSTEVLDGTSSGYLWKTTRFYDIIFIKFLVFLSSSTDIYCQFVSVHLRERSTTLQKKPLQNKPYNTSGGTSRPSYDLGLIPMFINQNNNNNKT